MSQAWYALQVRSKGEQTTASYLDAIGHEILLPTYAVRKKFSDRVKTVRAPLFPGYVFCRMDVQNRLPVLKAPGVLSIVKFGPEFTPVPPQELAAVRMMEKSPLYMEPWPYLRVGESVRVEKGPLAGLEGILLEIKNKYRLVISVHLLQRSVAAEVSLDWVTLQNRTNPIRNFTALNLAGCGTSTQAA